MSAEEGVSATAEFDRTPMPPGTSLAQGKVLRVLGDPVSMGVMASLSGKGRDAHALVVATGLPQSSVYRKLRELSTLGLVGLDRIAFTREGRKVELFGLRVRSITVTLENGRIAVSVVPRRDSSDNFQSLWAELRRSRA